MILNRNIQINENVAHIELAVEINEGETYYLIDEVIPEGWNVISASDGGSYEAFPGHIRWVVIQNAYDYIYSYELEIPTGVGRGVFHGLYMGEGDKVEQPIMGESVINVENGSVQVTKAHERIADDAVRTSYLANIDAQDALDNFVRLSRKVEGLTDPTHEQERYNQHDADMARDNAIVMCKYIVEYGIVGVEAAEEAMTVASTNREILHATGLVAKAKGCVKDSNMTVQLLAIEIEKYKHIDAIQKRTLRAEIVIQLQKEREARAINDVEVMKKAIALKEAALAKLIELYNV